MDWMKQTAELLNFRKDCYHRLGEVRRIAVDGSSIAAEVDLDDGGLALVKIDICSDTVVRLRISDKPIGETPTLMVVQHDWPNVGLKIDDSADRLIIKTTAIRVVINKKPWDFRILGPDGRELLAEEADDRRAFGTSFVSQPIGIVREGELTSVVGAFRMSPDEQFYGFGEKFGSLDKRGRQVRCFNQGSGTWTEGEHKNVPFFMSSNGYGVFFNSSYPMLFDMGVRSNATWSFALADRRLDVYFMYGPTYKQIISSYTEITGRPKLPPKWSFGIWMSRHTYSSRAEMEQVAQRLRDEQLPCDVLKIDTGWFHKPGRGSVIDYDMEWNEQAFPDPAGFISGLRKKGFRVCLFINSWVLSNSAKANEARRLGYLVKKHDGAEHTWDMGSQCPVVAFDLTNPDCRAWYQRQLQALLAQGVSTFFCDWGVDAPIDNAYAGMDGLQYSNLHSLLYIKTVYEAIEQFTKESAVVWGIAGWAGIQRYPTTYGGDSRCTFRDMASVLRGGLSAAMSGIGFWGCDIGGFGRVETGPPDPTLYIRYLQHGFFLPFSEFHGIGAREPWNFGREAVQIYKRYADLRYRLLPYLYAQAHHACHTGIPMLRPMALEFQDDRNTAHLDLQYMLGDSFLVAPVFGHETRRAVYLPAGTWFDYWTKMIHRGPAWITCQTPLDTMPLFVRGGSIVPMGPAVNFVDELTTESMTLDVYPVPGQFAAPIYDDIRGAATVQGHLGRDHLKLEVPAMGGRCCIDIHGLPTPRRVTWSSRLIDDGRVEAGVIRISGPADTGATVVVEWAT
jgi:alpha-D-xyloside xylohydrolase